MHYILYIDSRFVVIYKIYYNKFNITGTSFCLRMPHVRVIHGITGKSPYLAIMFRRAKLGLIQGGLQRASQDSTMGGGGGCNIFLLFTR